MIVEQNTVGFMDDLSQFSRKWSIKEHIRMDWRRAKQKRKAERMRRHWEWVNDVRRG